MKLVKLIPNYNWFHAIHNRAWTEVMLDKWTNETLSSGARFILAWAWADVNAGVDRTRVAVRAGVFPGVTVAQHAFEEILRSR